MDFKTSKDISPAIRQKYLKGEEGKIGFIVYALKDAAGNIGAYTVNRQIPGDSPVTYLDIDGNFLASFHIFSKHDDQDKYDKIIKRLKERFPVTERLN